MPHQPNIISTCTTYYRVAEGDYCLAIVTKYGNFTLNDFYTWNPDVGTDCSNLLLNNYVCINAPKPATTTKTSTPVPTQPGTISCCKTFYKVVKNDSCVGVENKFKISDGNFRKWNTGIDKDCFNLQENSYVCVGV
ncbi:carbohydrate-binding module family 50 protein [Melanomma pulvis-pyrius CBS 109.77]|uniref:Carbohydrate-binding module family 50 protein n=1 Tax=Melanomma pulvis-pyrius CBS 109.77 TaxID=1314802 RepID=A0A6A6X4N5_9PLEO|nr:carbohydrate-binding module family 50 protein [Melanomma pulvis-pyrius CBS 109.77]